MLQLGLHTAGGSGSTRNQLEISLVQGFIHPKINSLGDGHGVLLLVALGSGGEPSPLPAAGAPIPFQEPGPHSQRTEELQCCAGLCLTVVDLVQDSVVAVVCPYDTQIPLLLCS